MEETVKAFIFHGTRPYGIHVVVARNIERACKLVGVPLEKCKPWLEDSPDKRYGYQVLEEGDVEDFGE